MVAKEYLGQLGNDKAPDQVQEQLVHDVDDKAGRVRLQIDEVSFGEMRYLKGHKQSATCLCLTSDERTVYSGGKDCAILRWDVETGKKDVFPGGKNLFQSGGHFSRVLSMSWVEERNLLLSAGADRMVRLWDPRAPPKTPCIEKLLGHHAPVTCVASDSDGSHFYSASLDKSLKVWDFASRKAINTLFGHVTGITAMDLYNKGRPVTGGADKTARLWKLDKDTHLMFSKHTCPVDAVAILDSDRFVSGSQDGNLLLWSHGSKKPVAIGSTGNGQWISALGTIRRGNVAFSGSVDGKLHAWSFTRNNDEDRLLKCTSVASLQAPGCVNAIAVGRRFLACALGQEHKHGRWFYDCKQRNGIMFVPLSYRES